MVNTTSNLFTFSLNFNSALACFFSYQGGTTSCSAYQSLTLTSVTGIVTVTLYLPTDSPYSQVVYQFTVNQPICNVLTFLPSSAFLDPVNCTLASPLDPYSKSSNCVANSSNVMVDFAVSSSNACFNPVYQFLNESVETWVDCFGTSCDLSLGRNYFRVVFDNANNPSYVNISNGLLILLMRASHVFAANAVVWTVYDAYLSSDSSVVSSPCQLFSVQIYDPSSLFSVNINGGAQIANLSTFSTSSFTLQITDPLAPMATLITKVAVSPSTCSAPSCLTLMLFSSTEHLGHQYLPWRNQSAI